MADNTMGIYIHIPFCIKKCNYCDFLSFPVIEEIKPHYVNRLVNEIEQKGALYGRTSENPYTAATVFFGGGTPSIMESGFIHSIMKSLNNTFQLTPDCEITMECNPGTLNLLKLSDYKYMGINRLSIGLQSANDIELKSLGRIHNYTSFVESFRDARSTGFDNINIDIMSALPGQTLSSYTDTLKKVLSLEPEHISAYSLIIEEGTPFFNIYNNYCSQCSYPPLPDEDTEREMYYETREILLEKSYKRYEISNYALEGKECKHNLSYWKRNNYLGFGIGAASFIDNVRYKNIGDLDSYIKCPQPQYDEVLPLTDHDSMSEFMFLGLRMMNGIKKEDFKKEFNVDMSSIFGKEIAQLVKDGLMVENNHTIMLTNKGIDLSNYVFSHFIFD